MSQQLTEMVSDWASRPYITHDDVTKCGLCWKQKIQSDVCKEYLQTNQEVTSENLTEILATVKREWKKTPLYQRVQELLTQGQTLEQISEDLLKEGIEI